MGKVIPAGRPRCALRRNGQALSNVPQSSRVQITNVKDFRCQAPPVFVVGRYPYKNGQCVRLADIPAHRDGKRFVVRADDKLAAFVELELEALTVTFYIESIHADSGR
jgi:hypothetical protein